MQFLWVIFHSGVGFSMMRLPLSHPWSMEPWSLTKASASNPNKTHWLPELDSSGILSFLSFCCDHLSLWVFVHICLGRILQLFGCIGRSDLRKHYKPGSRFIPRSQRIEWQLDRWNFFCLRVLRNYSVAHIRRKLETFGEMRNVYRGTAVRYLEKSWSLC